MAQWERSWQQGDRTLPSPLFPHNLSEFLRDPTFKAAWEWLQPEIQIREAVLQYRIEQELSQSDLAGQVHMPVQFIQAIESLNANPTIAQLVDLAQGMGKSLSISFSQFNGARTVYCD